MDLPTIPFQSTISFQPILLLLLIFLVISFFSSYQSESFTPYSWRKYYPWGGYRTYWDEYDRHCYPYEKIPYWKRLLY